MTVHRPGRFDPAAAVYLVVAPVVVVHLVVGDDPARTLRGAAPYLAAAATLVAVAAVGIRWQVRTDVWLRVLAMAGCAVAIWLLVAFAVALPSGFGDPAGFYTVKVQVGTPVGDHNTAAGLLLPGLAAAAVVSSTDRRWLAALVTIAFGLAATLSRGASVVLLVAVAVTWPLVSERAARLRLLAVGAAVLVVVTLAAVVLGAAPAAGAPDDVGPVGPSVVARADLMVRGFEIGADEPLHGVGLRGYEDHAPDLPPPRHHAHNAIAHAFAEGGVPLATVAIALPLLLGVRLWRTRPGGFRDALVVGGVALVLQAQHDILGGLVGYEVLLALLVALAGLVRMSPATPA